MRHTYMLFISIYIEKYMWDIKVKGSRAYAHIRITAVEKHFVEAKKNGKGLTILCEKITV